MNKRLYQRFAVQNFVADISDGDTSYLGIVGDISRGGILLTGIPQDLCNREKLSIIVSGNGENQKMLVVPKWVSENDSEQKMGLAIIEPTLAWSLLVMNCEPKLEDIWALTTHLPDC